MNINEQLIRAILDNSVHTNVLKMLQPNYEFNGHKDRMPINLFEMNFRLFRPTQTYINFEFLVNTPIGKFFQPIGIFSEYDTSLQLLNEYKIPYESIKSSVTLSSDIKFLDLKTNAVIAAFSWQTIQQVLLTFEEFQKTGWQPEFKNGMMIPATMRYDKRFECNGLSCELLFCNEGYPQFYLDDDHNLEGAIGAYLQNDGLSIHPTVEYKDLFDNLSKLKLLTAFTKI